MHLLSYEIFKIMPRMCGFQGSVKTSKMSKWFHIKAIKTIESAFQIF